MKRGTNLINTKSVTHRVGRIIEEIVGIISAC